MDLCIEKSKLSNFADDTQSIVISENIEEAQEIMIKEANSVIEYFESNNLVNNSDKAAILYNSKGKGRHITIENIGGEKLKSSSSEKLLGLHVDSNLEWSTHIKNITIDLKKRIGLLRRIRNRIPKSKLVMIAEAIFNSKLRYGIAIYLNPIFDDEDLKWKRLSEHARDLQTLQNTMLRTIFNLDIRNCVNMKKIREKVNMMSVNQMNVYHTLIEAFNVIRNSSSEQIKTKWERKNEIDYFLRSKTTNDTQIPEKPKKKCTGFSYIGAKLFNKLPREIKEISNPKTFKVQTRAWVWKNIPY